MEKCIWHPWATDEEGWCWMCEELRYANISTEIKFKVDNMLQERRDEITYKVMEDLASRSKRGIEKYNTTLEENNHQNMLQHAYEEALDLAQYLKKEITTLNTVQDLVKEYKDDQELGKKVRELYSVK